MTDPQIERRLGDHYKQAQEMTGHDQVGAGLATRYRWAFAAVIVLGVVAGTTTLLRDNNVGSELVVAGSVPTDETALSSGTTESAQDSVTTTAGASNTTATETSTPAVGDGPQLESLGDLPNFGSSIDFAVGFQVPREIQVELDGQPSVILYQKECVDCLALKSIEDYLPESGLSLLEVTDGADGQPAQAIVVDAAGRIVGREPLLADVAVDMARFQWLALAATQESIEPVEPVPLPSATADLYLLASFPLGVSRVADPDDLGPEDLVLAGEFAAVSSIDRAHVAVTDCCGGAVHGRTWIVALPGPVPIDGPALDASRVWVSPDSNSLLPKSPYLSIWDSRDPFGVAPSAPISPPGDVPLDATWLLDGTGVALLRSEMHAGKKVSALELSQLTDSHLVAERVFVAVKATAVAVASLPSGGYVLAVDGGLSFVGSHGNEVEFIELSITPVELEISVENPSLLLVEGAGAEAVLFDLNTHEFVELQVPDAVRDLAIGRS